MADDDVRFTGTDMMVLLGHLTAAVSQLTVATTALSTGRSDEAGIASARAGEKVDAIIDLMKSKMSPEASNGSR